MLGQQERWKSDPCCQTIIKRNPSGTKVSNFGPLTSRQTLRGWSLSEKSSGAGEGPEAQVSWEAAEKVGGV